jgi:hypothetical protein
VPGPGNDETAPSEKGEYRLATTLRYGATGNVATASLDCYGNAATIELLIYDIEPQLMCM